jgi:hypothetical protein
MGMSLPYYEIYRTEKSIEAERTVLIVLWCVGFVCAGMGNDCSM